MWCCQCQQDVPAVGAAGGLPSCPRCQSRLGRPQPNPAALGRPADAGISLANEMTPAPLPEFPKISSPGQPWPYIDLTDGASIGVMGIQGSEGPAALEAVAELRAMVATSGKPDGSS